MYINIHFLLCNLFQIYLLARCPRTWRSWGTTGSFSHRLIFSSPGSGSGIMFSLLIRICIRGGILGERGCRYCRFFFHYKKTLIFNQEKNLYKIAMITMLVMIMALKLYGCSIYDAHV